MILISKAKQNCPNQNDINLCNLELSNSAKSVINHLLKTLLKMLRFISLNQVIIKEFTTTFPLTNKNLWGSFHANLTKSGEFSLGTTSEFDEIFTICLYHWEMKILKISALLTKGVLRYSLQKFWPISVSGWFLSFGPLLRAYNSVNSKGMNPNFFVLCSLTKDIQKTVIWGNLVFIWPPYWMAKNWNKHFFWFLSYFGIQIPTKLSKYTKYLWFV